MMVVMSPNPELEARLQRIERLYAEGAERDLARAQLLDEENRRRDERIDALTQSVELLASMHRDTEGRVGRLESALTDLSVTMNRLANIVIRHDERLDSLDGGDEQ